MTTSKARKNRHKPGKAPVTPASKSSPKPGISPSARAPQNTNHTSPPASQPANKYAAPTQVSQAAHRQPAPATPAKSPSLNQHGNIPFNSPPPSANPKKSTTSPSSTKPISPTPQTPTPINKPKTPASPLPTPVGKSSTLPKPKTQPMPKPLLPATTAPASTASPKPAPLPAPVPTAKPVTKSLAAPMGGKMSRKNRCKVLQGRMRMEERKILQQDTKQEGAIPKKSTTTTALPSDDVSCSDDDSCYDSEDDEFEEQTKQHAEYGYLMNAGIDSRYPKQHGTRGKDDYMHIRYRVISKHEMDGMPAMFIGGEIRNHFEDYGMEVGSEGLWRQGDPEDVPEQAMTGTGFVKDMQQPTPISFPPPAKNRLCLPFRTIAGARHLKSYYDIDNKPGTKTPPFTGQDTIIQIEHPVTLAEMKPMDWEEEDRKVGMVWPGVGKYEDGRYGWWPEKHKKRIDMVWETLSETGEEEEEVVDKNEGTSVGEGDVARLMLGDPEKLKSKGNGSLFENRRQDNLRRAIPTPDRPEHYADFTAVIKHATEQKTMVMIMMSTVEFHAGTIRPEHARWTPMGTVMPPNPDGERKKYDMQTNERGLGSKLVEKEEDEEEESDLTKDDTLLEMVGKTTKWHKAKWEKNRQTLDKAVAISKANALPITSSPQPSSSTLQLNKNSSKNPVSSMFAPKMLLSYGAEKITAALPATSPPVLLRSGLSSLKPPSTGLVAPTDPRSPGPTIARLADPPGQEAATKLLTAAVGTIPCKPVPTSAKPVNAAGQRKDTGRVIPSTSSKSSTVPEPRTAAVDPVTHQLLQVLGLTPDKQQKGVTIRSEQPPSQTSNASSKQRLVQPRAPLIPVDFDVVPGNKQPSGKHRTLEHTGGSLWDQSCSCQECVEARKQQLLQCGVDKAENPRGENAPPETSVEPTETRVSPLPSTRSDPQASASIKPIQTETPGSSLSAPIHQDIRSIAHKATPAGAISGHPPQSSIKVMNSGKEGKESVPATKSIRAPGGTKLVAPRSIRDLIPQIKPAFKPSPAAKPRMKHGSLASLSTAPTATAQSNVTAASSKAGSKDQATTATPQAAGTYPEQAYPGAIDPSKWPYHVLTIVTSDELNLLIDLYHRYYAWQCPILDGWWSTGAPFLLAVVCCIGGQAGKELGNSVDPAKLRELERMVFDYLLIDWEGLERPDPVVKLDKSIDGIESSVVWDIGCQTPAGMYEPCACSLCQGSTEREPAPPDTPEHIDFPKPDGSSLRIVYGDKANTSPSLVKTSDPSGDQADDGWTWIRELRKYFPDAYTQRFRMSLEDLQAMLLVDAHLLPLMSDIAGQQSMRGWKDLYVVEKAGRMADIIGLEEVRHTNYANFASDLAEDSINAMDHRAGTPSSTDKIGRWSKHARGDTVLPTADEQCLCYIGQVADMLSYMIPYGKFTGFVEEHLMPGVTVSYHELQMVYTRMYLAIAQLRWHIMPVDLVSLISHLHETKRAHTCTRGPVVMHDLALITLETLYALEIASRNLATIGKESRHLSAGILKHPDGGDLGPLQFLVPRAHGVMNSVKRKTHQAWETYVSEQVTRARTKEARGYQREACFYKILVQEEHYRLSSNLQAQFLNLLAVLPKSGTGKSRNIAKMRCVLDLNVMHTSACSVFSSMLGKGHAQFISDSTWTKVLKGASTHMLFVTHPMAFPLDRLRTLSVNYPWYFYRVIRSLPARKQQLHSGYGSKINMIETWNAVQLKKDKNKWADIEANRKSMASRKRTNIAKAEEGNEQLD